MSKGSEEKLLFTDVIGQGTRPIVVLHGFLGSGRNLGTLARRLAADDPLSRVLLPDQLGHGRSPPLPEGADLFTLADAVFEMLDEHSVTERATIVGHSLGGRVALAMAKQASHRVGRIVLLDIAPGPTTQLPAAEVVAHLAALPEEAASRDDFAAPLVAQGFERPFVIWLLMNLERTDHGTFRWRIDRTALLDMHRRSSAIDLWSVIESRADVHVIRGALSPYVADTDVARFGEYGIAVETVAGAGHFVFADRADETFERIRRMLD